MNERIKAIAEQCVQVEYHSNGLSYEAGFDREKFAELIVRECMKVCKKTEQYEVGNQDPDKVGCIRAGGVFCREDIKEHFGVEE